MSNQITSLLNLAWKRSAGDISTVIAMYAGMWIFILAFFVLAALNVAVVPNAAIVPASDPYLVAFLNAITMLTYIAIVAILFRYAASFTSICYYYDNESWMIPNLLRNLCISIVTYDKKQSRADAELYNKNRLSLKSEVLMIRNGTDL
jgi:fatty acid desaturase